MSKSPLFSVNEFNKPKILEGARSDLVLLYYIVIGRDDSNITPDIKFNINKYRFTEIEKAKSEIETSLRNHITLVAPEIYLDNIDVTRVNTGNSRTNKLLYFTLNIINQSNNQRSSIFFKITNKEQNHLLVELVNNK